jgi:hypothetical protein
MHPVKALAGSNEVDVLLHHFRQSKYDLRIKLVRVVADDNRALPAKLLQAFESVFDDTHFRARPPKFQGKPPVTESHECRILDRRSEICHDAQLDCCETSKVPGIMTVLW